MPRTSSAREETGQYERPLHAAMLPAHGRGPAALTGERDWPAEDVHGEGRPSSDGEGRLVFPEGYIAGPSVAMATLHAQMAPLLRGDIPVLLLGETGVGKEVLAQTLHLSSKRRAGPFVAVNCAAIPADLLEAEMFGIGRGVATGVSERKGRFQLAEGGTLFLDEIGEMPPLLQAKLLRALQGREVQPVGGAPTAVDVRVVAATNCDLHARLQDGRFRRDLYYRVAGFTLRVPPLRERRVDIPALVDGLAATFAREAGRTVGGMTVEARRALLEYSWPGNVRELEHEVRRLAYLCPSGGDVGRDMLSEHIAHPEATAMTTSLPSLDMEDNIAQLERALIGRALARAGGRRASAARLLGISRNGLTMKMARLGLIGRPDATPAPAGTGVR